MNIDPLSTNSFHAQPKVQGREAGREPVQARQEENDRLSTELSSRVRATLAEMPEIRPEAVERGRQLMADPNYPSPEVVRRIASLITPFAEG